jgi:hypothetical protein
MSTSIDQAFIRQYEADVHLTFQREGGYLRPGVRMKTNILGKSTTFQKIGKGTATTKARHGVITPMNQDHTPHECTLVDFYAGDWVDKLDEAKINIDERMAIAKSGAYALGRKVDSQIITVLDSTTQTAVTITVTSSNAVRNGLLEMVEGLNGNDVPNDGGRYAILSPRMWSQAMTVKEFSSADWVGTDGLPYTKGAAFGVRWKDWMGVKWQMHTDTPGAGTATNKNYAWHKNAIGYATGRHAGNVAESESVSADITWHGDRAAHFVNHCMSGGSVMIDDTGVIEGTNDDTTAIATS